MTLIQRFSAGLEFCLSLVQLLLLRSELVHVLLSLLLTLQGILASLMQLSPHEFQALTPPVRCLLLAFDGAALLGDLLELLIELLSTRLLVLLPIAQPGELTLELTHHLDRVAELRCCRVGGRTLRRLVRLGGRLLGHGVLSLVLHGKRALVTAGVCIGVIG